MRKPLPGNRGSREDLGKGKGVEVKNTVEFEFPQLLVIDARRGHDDSFGTGRIKPRGLFNEFQMSALRSNPDLPELLFAPFPMTEADAMPSYARAGEGGYMAWCDIDHKHLSEEQWELLDDLDAEIVASGTPGHYQVFVHLDSATPAHHVEALNRALCEKLDGDPSKVVRSAIMRLPGGYNTKGGKRRRAMRMRDSLTLWSAPELASALGTELPDADARTRAQSERQTPTGPLTAVAPRGPKLTKAKSKLRTNNQMFHGGAFKTRHDAVFGLTKDLAGVGLTLDEALWVMEQCETRNMESGTVDQGCVAAHEKAADERTSVLYQLRKAWDKPEVVAKLGTQTTEEDDEPEPEAQSEAIAGDEFWESRPILTHIRDFARARYVAPWAMLGAVMTRVSTVIPHRVTLPPTIGSRKPISVFVGIVDSSGGGKGAAVSSARDCIGLPIRIPVIGLGSGEGIVHQYRERRKNDDGEMVIHTVNDAVMFMVNEIDTLTAMTGRSASTITPMLCSAWMGEELGFAYVDKSKALPMDEHSYRLTLVCGIQPERARPLMQSADSGLAQRFLWLPAVDLEAPDFSEDTPDIARWEWSLPELKDGEFSIPVAHSVVVEVKKARHATMSGRVVVPPLDAHRNLSRLKVAAILGFLDGRAEVSENDWELAGVLMTVSDSTRDGVVETLKRLTAEEARDRGKSKGIERAATEEEVFKLAAAVDWVWGVIERQGRETGGELKRRCPKRLKEHLRPALDSLVGAGKIHAELGARKDSVTWVKGVK